jgi:hypothetical protein
MEVPMRIMVLGLVAVMLQATAAAAADVGPPGARNHQDRYYQPRWGWPFDHHPRRGPPPTWCNQGNEATGGVMDCSYFSLQQCVTTASGLGGSCIPNPAFDWARHHRGRPHGWRY